MFYGNHNEIKALGVTNILQHTSNMIELHDDVESKDGSRHFKEFTYTTRVQHPEI